MTEIALYFKDHLYIKRIMELGNQLDEMIWVEICTKGEQFFLCNTYRPEWTDDLYRSQQHTFRPNFNQQYTKLQFF